MTTRYYEERECDHGRVGQHRMASASMEAFLAGMDPDDEAFVCPGGLRRELTDTEIVEAEWDGHGRAYLPFSGSSAGRYLIAPLDDPE